jgi:RNA polymerase sigma factor (TIGR02999 family)
VGEWQDVTQLLAAVSAGDLEALNALLPIVYDELRRRAAAFMQRERADHTLEPTALVHEAFVLLVQQERVDWKGRAHFFGIASQLMRRVLVDHARAHLTDKRGGAMVRIPIDDEPEISLERDSDVLAVDDALRRLAELRPEHAQIVEMRFFGGLSVEEVAAVLGAPKRTVEAHWTFIRAWLRRELGSR